MNGGWNIGNAIQTGIIAGGATSSSTDNCFVVDDPEQLRDCKVDNPYQSRFKVSPLPVALVGYSDCGRVSEPPVNQLRGASLLFETPRSSRRSGGHCPAAPHATFSCSRRSARS